MTRREPGYGGGCNQVNIYSVNLQNRYLFGELWKTFWHVRGCIYETFWSLPTSWFATILETVGDGNKELAADRKNQRLLKRFQLNLVSLLNSVFMNWWRSRKRNKTLGRARIVNETLHNPRWNWLKIMLHTQWWIQSSPITRLAIAPIVALKTYESNFIHNDLQKLENNIRDIRPFCRLLFCRSSVAKYNSSLLQ